MNASPCLFCGSVAQELLADYVEPPLGETKFSSLSGKAYRRQVFRCENCWHFTSACQMDISKLYDEEYINATYRDDAGVRQTFERIISLPAEKSDNAGRVERVCQFAGDFLGKTVPRRLIDIGAGLAVFPWAMKQLGWDCVALDPDPRAARHAKEVAGVQSICADFLRESLAERFPLVTLNKVLEHVPDPIAMLRRAAMLLEQQGLLYIEIPDGEAAFTGGGRDREEFFIEHLHVFSAASVALLARHVGLRLLKLERLQEPSSKYTLFAFLALPGPVAGR